MDIEYHYYITYLIAIKSGFETHEAYTIAYSSQFVDDNCYEYIIYNANDSQVEYKNFISAINEKTLNFSKLDEILIPFHFLPDVKTKDSRKDGAIHPFNTVKNSTFAEYILINALKSGNLYWIGIATHAYVDTWAHQNFVGVLSNYNALDNFLAKLLPNIGHLDVVDKPDLVGLIWKDTRLKKVEINNVHRFTQASKKLMNMYLRFTGQCNFNKSKFISELKFIMNNGNKNSYLDVKRLKSKRIKQYNHIVKKISNFDILNYNGHCWRDESIIRQNAKRYIWKKNAKYKKSNWFKFQESIKHHHDFVMSNLNLLSY
jgi:hypothetical protein